MKKYLILLDLDGTLLSSDQTISQFNKDTIQKAREKGHKVSIVTGRAHYRSNWYYDELGLDTVFLNRNAGVIHHPFQDEFADIVEVVKKELIEEILDSAIEPYIKKMYFESKNTIYVLRGDKNYYLNKQFSLIEIVDLDQFHIEDEINLVSMFVHEDHTTKVIDYLKSKEAFGIEAFELRREKGTIIQLYPKETNKKNAIAFLSDYYDIPKEQIIAIGDGGNDIEMIDHAGIGVAMENAIDEVKAVSDVVLEKNNDESAVGHFLNEFLAL